MVQIIGAREFRIDQEKQKGLPLVFIGTGLEIRCRTFSSEFVYYHLIQDIYEVSNRTAESLPLLIIPGGASFLIIPEKNCREQAVFCGTLTYMHKIMVPAGASMSIARFRDGSGEWLAGEKMGEMVDRSLPLSVLFSLEEEPEGCYESHHERMMKLFGVFAEHSADEYQTVAVMERCIQMIYRKHGCANVTDLAETAGCSERYLNKLFRRYMGVSTKTFCEMIQVQYSLSYIVSVKPKSLLQVAVDYGYFDQTHMNRCYKKFLKCTANDMRRPERQITRIEEIHVFKKNTVGYEERAAV